MEIEEQNFDTEAVTINYAEVPAADAPLEGDKLIHHWGVCGHEMRVESARLKGCHARDVPTSCAIFG